MAHQQQLDFIKNFSDLIYDEKKGTIFDILEIGSYEVNGSLRKYFLNSNYLGIDLIEGPGVDKVLDGSKIQSLNKKFDIIISSECFEHAHNWKEIFNAMINSIKDEGYVLMTCASKGRAEHGTNRSDFFDSAIHKHEVNSSPGTNDEYYKNLGKKDFFKNFKINDIFENYFFFYNIHSFDLYFIGQKKKVMDSLLIEKLENRIKELNKAFPSFQSIKRFLLHSLLPEKICNDLHFKNLRRKLK